MVLISIVAIAVVGLWLNKWDKRRWAAEYVKMLNGEPNITSITFIGQQKRLLIDDPDIIRDVQNAFRTNGTNGPQAGLAYDLLIVLKTGIKVNTQVYLYQDQSGFAIADYTRVGAGDPMMVNAEFGSNTGDKTKKMIMKLLAKD